MNEEFADSGEMMKQLKALKERITEAERVLLTAEIRLSDQIEVSTRGVNATCDVTAGMIRWPMVGVLLVL